MKMFNAGGLKNAYGHWLAGILGLGLLALPAAGDTLVGGLGSGVRAQIQALQDEKATFTATEQKMDSQLIFAYKKAMGLPIAGGAVPSLVVAAAADTNGMILVDIKANVTSNLLTQIVQSGGSISNSFPQYQSIRANIPLTQVESVASSPDLIFIRQAVKAYKQSDPEGVVVHRDGQARSTFQVNGSNVKVGVMSDSVDYLTSAQSTGDCGPVTVLSGQSGDPDTGEGTAMLEIVYAMAPGAQLYFATGKGGEATFAQNITDLRAAGCDIIVDDIIYPTESPFQDGTVAQAVNAVTAGGGLYFSSAGNEGNLDSGNSGTWEGDFVNGGAVVSPVNGKGGYLHTFGGGLNYDVINASGEFVNLFWSDPAGASTNDYDLYLLDSTGTTVIASSVTVQNGSQDPFEFLPLSTTPGQLLVIVQASGTNRFLYTSNFRGQFSKATAGNIVGHCTATNAFAVAAVDCHDSYPNPFSGGAADPVENFSSDGPRQVFYNADGSAITPGNFSSTGGYVRPKPDIAAANGVTTTLPSDSGLNPFYGTSAAAPHAAAIAALVKSYNPAVTPAQMRSILTSNTLDIMAPGFDQDSGFGIVMALQALEGTPLPAATPNFGYVTNILAGGNGNGIIDVDECDNLFLVLTNVGTEGATHIQATLSTLTPGVLIPQATLYYPDTGTNTSVTNTNAFELSIEPTFVCGSSVNFLLNLKYDQGSSTVVFSLPSGETGTPVRFDNSNPVTITNGTTGGISVIAVTNFNTAVKHVSVSAYVAETFDYGLTLQLIGPDGATITLAQQDGGAGQNFGVDCSDSNRVVFDDTGIPLGNSAAPFVGTFAPIGQLSTYIGKTGSNVNGNWQLVGTDPYTQDAAAIECWSLFLTGSQCLDGGGQCPGVDLAAGASAPASAIILNQYTYNLSVTNFGPDTALAVSLTQTLPTNVTIVSVSSSQGNASQFSGVVSCNFGSLVPGAVATATVVVVPTSTGTVFSTVNVGAGANQQELNPANNSVTVATTITAPSADLSVKLQATPNPTYVNGLLTYVATVANVGPSVAPNIFLTNTLPLNVSFVSATSSQGSVPPPQANVVVTSLGTLGVGSNATVTIQVHPLVQGIITDVAVVASSASDPVSANNTATVTTTVSPAADVALSISAPSSVIVGSNFTYQLAVTNNGPSAATLVTVSDTLPSSLKYVSASAGQGAFAFANGTFNCQITNLAAGASDVINIVVATTNIISVPATVVNTASVAAAQADPNPFNNTASASTVVAYPTVNVVPAGYLLASESILPTNGMIDPGETVTVLLKLQNTGNIPTAGNVSATLLSSGGVTPVGTATQNYGTLAANSLPTGEFYQCTVTGTNGGTATATLQLVTGGTNLGTANFTFNLPPKKAFAGTNNIIIPDHGPGSPYPSSNLVSGLTGLVGKVTVTLTNVNHTYPDDIDILLVGPLGQNVLLMSHAGYNGVLTNTSLTFDDSATNANGTTKYLPPSSQIVSGTYAPSQYGTVAFASNAPAQPYGTNLAVFNGTSPNGYWKLFVFDSSPGDDGIILGGYSLAITSGAEVNPVVDLALAGAAAPLPAQVGSNLTYTFTVTNNGPSASTVATFTDALPASLVFVSATNSAHTAFSLGASNVLACSFTNIAAGGAITITVVATPTLSGMVTNSATINGADSDPNQSNNSASVATTVNAPLADLAVTVSGTTNTALAGTVTYYLAVTNQGPGAALNAVLTNVFYGPATNNSNLTVSIYSLGTLPAGTLTNIVVSLTPTQPGLFTNVTTVATASVDTNLSNNLAFIVTAVTPPMPAIVAAGPPEFYNPVTYSSLPPGQPAEISLGLANVGTAPTSNLVATLLTTNGIIASSGATTYGVLMPGANPTYGNFNLTAAGTNGATVTATLQLQDGPNNLGTVTYTFGLPASNTFVGGAIVIPDHGPGLPYPSTINVANLNGYLNKATVTITNLSHQFANDVEILLVSPSGQGVVLMSDVGGPNPITNATLTFDDSATASLPASTTGAPVVSGTYLAADFGIAVPFASPAPAAPYNTNLAGFNGSSANGTWALYVLDNSPGDSGNIPAWSLSLSTVSPINGVADLGLSLTSPSTVYANQPFVITLAATNAGPMNATHFAVSASNLGSLGYLGTSYGGPAGLNGNSLNLYLGTIPGGSGTNFTVTLVAPTNGLYTTTFNVTSDQTDLNPGNNAASFTLSVHTLPQLSASVVRGGGSTNLVIRLASDPGIFTIQATTNIGVGLANWIPLATVTNISGTITLTDSNILSRSSRYYRAVRGF